ncbi:NUDIX hydrolase [Sphingomonas sp. SUN039]|uniref:NUDIX hydrolase n=1 Tax=Sphingomonas sp. SUN039 TaxID=2937787 RepID=UPI002164BCAB|nr:NUDIX hydrolase [Sphingomonas sp. SUN039]UVO55483.1 NUDIX hydrolase [Sphingomonas sp. SUN039]
MSSDAEEIVWSGKYITAKRRGPWEYVARARGIGAAVILAIDDGHVLLVEQWRVPLQRRCLELPAGLVGDETEGEDVATSAARELEEETGWRADTIEIVGEFASSPGMVSETFTLVTAHGLTKVGDGGGVPGEDITVHRVALPDVTAFVASKRAEGVTIDVKLLILISAWIP